MSIMITEVYNAFRKVGVPEKEAQDAAEALSNETTADIEKLDKKMIEINGEIKILKWMIGLVIAINVIPLLKSILA